MTTTPGDDVANMDQDAGNTVRSDDERRLDLPGVSSNDMDGTDASGYGQTQASGQDTGAAGVADTDDDAGIGDMDDVQPAAGAVEPTD